MFDAGCPGITSLVLPHRSLYMNSRSVYSVLTHEAWTQSLAQRGKILIRLFKDDLLIFPTFSSQVYYHTRDVCAGEVQTRSNHDLYTPINLNSCDVWCLQIRHALYSFNGTLFPIFLSLLGPISLLQLGTHAGLCPMKSQGHSLRSKREGHPSPGRSALVQ